MLALRTKRVRQKAVILIVLYILLPLKHNTMSCNTIFLPLQKSLKRSSVSTGHDAWSKHARIDSDLPSSSGRHVRHAPDDDQPDSDNDSLSSAESMT